MIVFKVNNCAYRRQKTQFKEGRKQENVHYYRASQQRFVQGLSLKPLENVFYSYARYEATTAVSVLKLNDQKLRECGWKFLRLFCIKRWRLGSV